MIDESVKNLMYETARIAIAKYKLHAMEFSEEAIIKDAVDAALDGIPPQSHRSSTTGDSK